MSDPAGGGRPPGDAPPAEGALTILPVRGLPEITTGADLARLIAGATDLQAGDVVVIAQKVVSKAEGAVAAPRPGEPTSQARRRVAATQATAVVARAGDLAILRTHHGFVCAHAGVDASNVPGGGLALLPVDPDASARRLRDALTRATGVPVAVIVTDTFGRPWRLGQTDVAIGLAGLDPFRDERGSTDRHGRPLEVTQVALADEVAAAADLVRGKASGTPVVVVRGLRYRVADGRASQLVRPPEQDLFPHGVGSPGWPAGAAAGHDALGDGPGEPGEGPGPGG